MKYISHELREEYERITKENPDIEGIRHPYINISDVLHAYFILADYFTDESSSEVEHMLVGLRSADLLGSALGRQTVSFGGRRKYHDPIDICATLFYGLVKDHAFSDGNKRTALLTLLYQLTLYGYIPSAPVNQYERLVISVAANTLDKDYAKAWKKFKRNPEPEILVISYLLRRMTKRKDNSYHVSPTMKEFCTALGTTGVTYEINGSKIHFTRIEKRVWHWGQKKYQYTVSFNGWTRTVGAKTARDTLEMLNLYSQYASYQDIFDQETPLYSLVDQFSVPLRRLKDE